MDAKVLFNTFRVVKCPESTMIHLNIRRKIRLVNNNDFFNKSKCIIEVKAAFRTSSSERGSELIFVDYFKQFPKQKQRSEPLLQYLVFQSCSLGENSIRLQMKRRCPHFHLRMCKKLFSTEKNESFCENYICIIFYILWR